MPKPAPVSPRAISALRLLDWSGGALSVIDLWDARRAWDFTGAHVRIAVRLGFIACDTQAFTLTDAGRAALTES